MTDRSSGVRPVQAPAPFQAARRPAPLREDQIEILRGYGETIETEAGQVLIRAGDTTNPFLVVLQGEVQVVLIRGGDLNKGMSKYLVDRVGAHENIELLGNTEVRELRGEDQLAGVVVEDNRSGSRRTLTQRRCSSSSGLRPTRAGSEEPQSSTNVASS